MDPVAQWLQQSREILVERGMLQLVVRVSPRAQEEALYNLGERENFLAVSVLELTINDEAYESMLRIIATAFDISVGSVKIMRKWVDEKNNRMVDILIRVE